MRVQRVEPSRIFSVYLPASLYEKILNKAGKGSVSTFIKLVLEKELIDEEQKQKEQLRKRLIEAYKRESKSKEVQEEMAILEGVASDSLDDK
jgi:metal-responsive CopG/Arc/MetJ family transcriptional regulator